MQNQDSTRLNDGTYIINARQVQVPNNSHIYLEASKELAKACLLTQDTKDRVKTLMLSPNQEEKAIQIIKNALNYAYNEGCVEVLERFIR